MSLSASAMLCSSRLATFGASSFLPRLLLSINLSFRHGENLLTQVHKLLVRSLIRRTRLALWRLVFHARFFLPGLSCGKARLVRSTFQHFLADERLVRQALAER